MMLGCGGAFTRGRGVSIVLNSRCCSGGAGKFDTSNSNTPASSFTSLGLASGKRKGHAVSS